MVWKIKFVRSGEKELRKLGPDNAKRILNFLRQRVLKAEHPRALGEPLHGPELGRFWKYRVGDYRIITQIRDRSLEILVVRIGHRRKIYR